MQLITVFAVQDTTKFLQLDTTPYEQTINVDHIVSFRGDENTTRISLINGEYLWTTTNIEEQLKEYFRRNGVKITKIGDK